MIVVMAALCLNSCKEVAINDVVKKKYIAGLPSQSNYILYEFNADVKASFSINNITLISGNEKTVVEQFSFINSQTMSGHKVTDFNKKFDRGIYEFTFRIDSDINYPLEEFINIDYTIDGKEYHLNNLNVKKGGQFNKR
ncbi:hypothetical protein DDD_0266 [Nonlabens dokdonensis DSW-6]|uniref:Uncharacterized protein n=1 Tax=Nonlabens dokdonensis (strain DSM 17205 / KCTC 12402 / DSW-6) TaxID=592029 RepID=L7W961_NONDD|nr:hypothetical protein DDD_0266 [Nonlabens dokdonensis DSW-6]